MNLVSRTDRLHMFLGLNGSSGKLPITEIMYVVLSCVTSVELPAINRQCVSVVAGCLQTDTD